MFLQQYLCFSDFLWIQYWSTKDELNQLISFHFSIREFVTSSLLVPVFSTWNRASDDELIILSVFVVSFIYSAYRSLIQDEIDPCGNCLHSLSISYRYISPNIHLRYSSIMLYLLKSTLQVIFCLIALPCRE